MKELQSTLLSKLPSWMVPDRLKTDEMKAQEIKDEIAEQQGRIKRSLDGKNEYRGFEDNGREKSAEIIAELQAKLAEINVAQAAAPAIVTNNIDNSTINNQSSTGTAVSIQGGFGSTYTPNPLNS
jgi:nitric oxide reductase activation protein